MESRVPVTATLTVWLSPPAVAVTVIVRLRGSLAVLSVAATLPLAFVVFGDGAWSPPELLENSTGTPERKLFWASRAVAVIVATGDRWHTPASILAAEAGKDVYCEKPCGLTIQNVLDLAATMRQPALTR